ncbi:hypothetical protein COCNU_03G004460 [Cocos nucifera]|uniref:Uncharacterized protein n=1 Tax=Cocos nucifera TaxID=13894 RepID=A0A8K0I1U7_COCNU|nr:hypothetical protein COCNU_03G004460 [Cocos nucifera]
MFALSVATGGLVLVTGSLGCGGHCHHLLHPALSIFMNLITFTLGILQMIVSVACFSTAPSVAATAAAAKGLRCLTLAMSFTALLLHVSLLLLTAY